MCKILLVDDSPDLVEFMSHLLSMNKFDVKTAVARQDVIVYLDEFMPDIILMDVKLNGEDGRELCRQLKETQRFNHIRSILMSANPSYLTDYYTYLADDILHKPFKIETLLNTISRNLS